VLLIRRAIDPGRGLWCFPGGYVDCGEDPAAAAVRECFEETGLTVDQLSLLDVSFNGRVIVITYLAQAEGDAAPIAADDADQVGWFAPDHLPPLAFESMARPIELWQQRSHDRRDAAGQRRAPRTSG
jgi:ADP-ribose pyrophosphatase YjhB (NUDIX family)